MLEVVSTTVGAVCLGLTCLVAVPASQSLLLRFNGQKTSDNYTPDKLYEDKDGRASKESQDKYTTIAPRIISLCTSILGFITAIVLAVLATTEQVQDPRPVETWLRVASWAVIVTQALAVYLQQAPVPRFSLGVQASISCLINVISLVIVRVDAIGQALLGDNQIALLSIQAGLALLSLFSFICIPRRPQVFDGTRPVDAEMTTSLFGRISYSWGGRLVKQAQVNRRLEYNDLPQLSYALRAVGLSERFDRATKCNKLWKTIVLEFRWAFFWQTCLVVTKSVLMFVPALAMQKILEILEGERKSSIGEAWLWVLLLGVTMLTNSVIENWLFWVIWTNLGIPMRNMLSTLIFQKSMRRKDVKGAGSAKNAKTTTESEEQPVVNENSGVLGETTAVETGEEPNKEDEGEEPEQKTRQGTINLVGVDSQRVGIFCTFAYFYPGTVAQITLSMIFLGQIIGWQSLLAGLGAFCLTIPVNIWASKNYSRTQTQLMDLRDRKLALTTEALQGIRQIKFSAMEQQWQERLEERRRQELHAQKWAFVFDTCLIGCYIISPALLSVASLGTYTLIYGGLAPSVAFTTLAILTSLEAALGVLPELTTDGIDALVSIRRIEEYLNAPEIDDCIDPSDHIVFEKASIAWPADEQLADEDRFILRDVDISMPPKELTVISGKTGSGKSLLLAALLGEIDKLSGTIYAPKPPRLEDRFDSKATKGNWIIDSAIAFVAQVPWIENATVRENILFGLPYDAGRYQKTLSACALTKDLEMLDDGDTTEIGHNGVNLSGGQRWRLSFARALYSRAGVLILDDIFSAVDAHVGRQLYEEALTGELAVGRTRILVTHHVSLVLPRAKYAVHLADGTVQYAGFVDQLRQEGRLTVALEEDPSVEPQESTEHQNHLEANGHDLTKVMSRRSERSAVVDQGGVNTKPKDKPRKFVEDEKRETGAIKPIVYKNYAAVSGSFWLWVPITVVYIANEFNEVARSWWVSRWTRSYDTSFETQPVLHSLRTASFMQMPMASNMTAEQLRLQTRSDDTIYYLSVYAGISLFVTVTGTLKYTAVFIASLRASRILFERLSYTILRAPLRWIDTVPVGRVLNRFTADFNVIDSWLAPHGAFFVYHVGETVGITAVSFIVSPAMIPLAAVLWIIASYVAYRFISAARSIKRLENNSKSPIFELFGSCLTGIATIRGYAKADEYIDRMYLRIDQYGRAYWNLWLLNRWMGFRLSMIGSLFTIFVFVTMVASRIDAALAGFALSFALQYSNAIIWVLRSYANLELDMTACERVMEFSSMETEDQGGLEPPAAWPTQGRLEVTDLVCGYAPELPPVLKGLTFTVDAGQRVGVVGRTGAGKSSLTLALFRFLEPRSGSIYIDGVDAAAVTLHALRSRLAIIPQDPVLFSGTVRSNLDAFGHHADHELRDALQRVHLFSGESTTRPSTAAPSGTATPTTDTAGPADTNLNIFRNLNSKISEGGLNLSQGQRQLLCLARSIVARPKLMVLDEATSAVDKETDELIQRSIREEFMGSTLLVIAHRLSTIADFDKILVMGDGKVLEYGTPNELMRIEGGTFRDMVNSSGEKEALEEVILGEKR